MRDQYVKEILIYCYDELRLYLATKGYCSYLFSMTEIRDKYSSFDKIYLDASLQHIRQNGWLYGTNPNIVTLSPAGVLYIEKNYHPSGIIHFTTLIFPILRICNDLLDTKE